MFALIAALGEIILTPSVINVDLNKKGFKENQDYIDKIVTLFNWRQSNEEDWKPREEHFKADFDDVLAKRRNSEDLPERYLLK